MWHPSRFICHSLWTNPSTHVIQKCQICEQGRSVWRPSNFRTVVWSFREEYPCFNNFDKCTDILPISIYLSIMEAIWQGLFLKLKSTIVLKTIYGSCFPYVDSIGTKLSGSGHRADICTRTKINNQFFIYFQTGPILHFSHIIIYIYIHIKCRSNPMRDFC